MAAPLAAMAPSVFTLRALELETSCKFDQVGMFLNPQPVSLAACSQDSPSTCNTCTRLISGYGYFMTS